MYDVKSSKAEEFINHEEILDTLAYAEANKENRELLDQILAKAATMNGLNHREAAVLLECPLPGPKKSNKRFTGTALYYLPLYICPTIVLTVVYIARIMLKTVTLPVRN